MYAVFRSGGKQYRAAKGDVLRLEKIEATKAPRSSLTRFCSLVKAATSRSAARCCPAARSAARLFARARAKKVSVVKFKRRQNYLRQGSHRQFFTEVEITGITGGSAKAAAPKKEADEKPAAEKAAKKPAAKKPAAKKTAAKKAGSQENSGEKAGGQEKSRQEVG